MKEIDKVIDIFLASEGKIKPHFMICGPSGSGKSHKIKTICEEKKINLIEVNAASLTKEGVSGNSLTKALSPLLVKKEYNIVLIDEYDKLFLRTNSGTISADTTTDVQNEFLKILEGETATVFGDYGKYHQIPIDKCLFVFAGAFNGEENVDIDKLRQFGLKTEFLGRVGLVYNFLKLELEELFTILENSELLNTYLKLFDEDREQVILTLKGYIKKHYDQNELGARLVTTLINSYFIKGGVLDKTEDIVFKTKLTLN